MANTKSKHLKRYHEPFDNVMLGEFFLLQWRSYFLQGRLKKKFNEMPRSTKSNLRNALVDLGYMRKTPDGFFVDLFAPKRHTSVVFGFTETKQEDTNVDFDFLNRMVAVGGMWNIEELCAKIIGASGKPSLHNVLVALFVLCYDNGITEEVNKLRRIEMPTKDRLEYWESFKRACAKPKSVGRNKLLKKLGDKLVD